MERGLTSAAIARVTMQHFSATGIPGKRTVDGSRRSSMQHAVHVLGNPLSKPVLQLRLGRLSLSRGTWTPLGIANRDYF